MAQVAGPFADSFSVTDVDLSAVSFHPHGGQAEARHFSGHADGGVVRFVGQRETLAER